MKRLESSNDTAAELIKQLKVSQPGSNDSLSSLMESHLIALQQIQTLNESLYGQIKKLVLLNFVLTMA